MPDNRYVNNLIAEGMLDDLEIAVVYLNADLSISGYSNRAASLLGINKDSIGAPLPAVYSAISESQLSEWISEAIESEQCILKDIQISNRKWLELRICAQETGSHGPPPDDPCIYGYLR